MFKSKDRSKNNAPATQQTSPSGATNMIAQGTHMEGTIDAGNDIRVDGYLKGTLNCKGRVIIGVEGEINGDVVCQNAIVEGSFNGTMNVKEVLTVKETAQMDGQIDTGKLNIQPGAVFNGTCTMGGQKLTPITTQSNKTAS